MTIRAVLWRGFVKQNRLALNLALQGMTQRTAHIFVRPCQRELSALIVVKCRRGPPLVHMATSAFRDSVLCNKLVAMRIRMTRFAIRWCSLELNLVRTSGHFVAFIARDRAMCSDQRKFRFRMVEASNIDP